MPNQNPQTQGSTSDQQTLLVIFGGTGDLSNRKLIPAIYNLSYGFLAGHEAVGEDAAKGAGNGDSGAASGKAPWKVLSIGRRDWDADRYRGEVKPWVEKFANKPYDDEKFAQFEQLLDYFELDVTNQEHYQQLFDYLDEHYQGVPRIYYFAMAPRFFDDLRDGLSQSEDGCKHKVIIEKPFGETLEQARELHDSLADVFSEENVYLIDHYLGKEMIRSIQALRSTNQIFGRSWDRDSIESIEITAAEAEGVGTRGGYYDQSGAMHDMVQNHLMQVLSILAMEQPEDDSVCALRQSQRDLLAALEPVAEGDLERSLVLAQYEGYRDEDKVDPASETDTYAAVVVRLNNERWKGVPFFIRTGKKLASRATYVVINFRRPEGAGDAEPNRLHLQIQPTEGVSLTFNIKRPGLTDEIKPVEMTFCQSCQADAHQNTPEAYERLLAAARDDRREFFSQWPQISATWQWVDSLMELWERAGKPLASYKQDSYGPAEADRMLSEYGATWCNGSLGPEDEHSPETPGVGWLGGDQVDDK